MNVPAIFSSETGCNSKDFSGIYKQMNVLTSVPSFSGRFLIKGSSGNETFFLRNKWNCESHNFRILRSYW